MCIFLIRALKCAEVLVMTRPKCLYGLIVGEIDGGLAHTCLKSAGKAFILTSSRAVLLVSTLLMPTGGKEEREREREREGEMYMCACVHEYVYADIFVHLAKDPYFPNVNWLPWDGRSGPVFTSGDHCEMVQRLSIFGP